MSRVRQADTAPERRVRTFLHKAGLRFRLHRRDLAGCPDVVFGAARIAVFINGCFWHQHEKCGRGKPPRSNMSYWVPKLEGNVRRDKRNANRLRRTGWSVHTVWECEVNDEKRLLRLVREIRTRRARLR